MILYIIRFSLALSLVYLFYKALLEKEKAFVFNRFFLIIGVVISLIPPFIPLPGTQEIKSILINAEQTADFQLIPWQNIINWLYLAITSIFLIRFSMDVFHLLGKMKKGKKIDIEGTQVILTQLAQPPHSFLNYVFIHEHDFEGIHQELIAHEITHVKQRHTYDILFIELVKAFFWINPVVGLIKKSMRLNHEFLADASAIKCAPSISSYQNILLTYFTAQDAPGMASGFNFSLTKKRFTMMTKQKTKTQIIKQILVLPLLALIIWSCSDNPGVSGKEMLKYWRYTASMEEILQTGVINNADLKEGIILPIENKKQYNELKDIYNRMNNTQKESVYNLPSYLGE
ncbi:M56 family metallopeptidase [Fulvivirga ligni]|uniref:M56 family metallopeptidase n=1 Tax=Fulvivirga ligni TaxID=2904246 RepID=UPI001F329724|nr:M56 family metallopeptidase [Fulvivirga ligni]UII20661.1 hypothetical protein LVD16_22735 [Fulvivirga ligni]